MTIAQVIQDEDPFIKHAALIMRQDKCTVGDARFRAWCEGPDGYSRRLEQDMEIEDEADCD